MEIIDFEGTNCVYAKDQPEYLPFHCYQDEEGCLTSCWKLSFKEKLKVLFSGKVWLQVLTFNKPLQPLRMQAENPLKEVK